MIVWREYSLAAVSRTDTATGVTTYVYMDTPERAEYDAFVAAGGVTLPRLPEPVNATQDWVADQLLKMMAKVTLRTALVPVVLGANGTTVKDLSNLGFADFDVIPQTTLLGTTLGTMRFVTSEVSAKDVSGTTRKITVTGRRLKIASAVTDLLAGPLEAAAAGDTVSLLVIEKLVPKT